jgi:hypothetical protein
VTIDRVDPLRPRRGVRRFRVRFARGEALVVPAGVLLGYRRFQAAVLARLGGVFEFRPAEGRGGAERWRWWVRAWLARGREARVEAARAAWRRWREAGELSGPPWVRRWVLAAARFLRAAEAATVGAAAAAPRPPSPPHQ